MTEREGDGCQMESKKKDWLGAESSTDVKERVNTSPSRWTIDSDMALCTNLVLG